MESLLHSNNPRACYEFKVEKIVGVSYDGNYKVQWAPAWVSKFHLVGCDHLIQEFLQQLPGKQVKSEPENPFQPPDTTPEIEGMQHSVQEFLQKQSDTEGKGGFENQLQASDITAEMGYSEHLVHEFLQQQSEWEANPTTEIEDVDLATEEQFERGVKLEIQHEAPYINVSLENDNSERRIALQKSDNNVDVSDTSTGLDILPESNVPVANRLNYHQKNNHQKVLDTHIGSHSGEPLYSCTGCEYSSSKEWKLAQHVSIHHKPYSCSACSKTFTSKITLNRHFNIHTEERAWKCSHCSAKFSNKYHLREHIRIHTGEKPYRCDHCAKSFTQKHTLKTHKCRSHNDLT